MFHTNVRVFLGKYRFNSLGKGSGAVETDGGNGDFGKLVHELHQFARIINMKILNH